MSIFDKLKYDGKISIDKGFSGEEKYLIYDTEDNQYLLKICGFNKKDRKNLEIKYKKNIENIGFNHSKLIDVKFTDNTILSLYQWINGVDLVDIVKTLNDEKARDYGKKAGKILYQIHSIKIDEPYLDWEVAFNNKIDKKIKNFNIVRQFYPKGEIFIKYVENNRQILKNRPQSLCHGDFHIGNMMIDNETKELVIVDFGSMEIGDPIEEFNRMVWNALNSFDFASGFIEGYFENRVIPEDFWKLMLFYISTDIIGSIPWGIDFDSKQLDVMTNRANKVLEWYNNLQKEIPSFYIKY